MTTLTRSNMDGPVAGKHWVQVNPEVTAIKRPCLTEELHASSSLVSLTLRFNENVYHSERRNRRLPNSTQQRSAQAGTFGRADQRHRQKGSCVKNE